MPVNWQLNCYGCSRPTFNEHYGPDVVALWTTFIRNTVGLCHDCLNQWLDDADNEQVDEPVRLDFLVNPAELMAAAT